MSKSQRWGARTWLRGMGAAAAEDVGRGVVLPRSEERRSLLGRFVRSRLAIALTTAVATMGVAGTVVAVADIPDSGVINGCVANNGSLKVVDTSAGQTCKAGETALPWNQQGPQGPQGPQGAQGLAGPAGPSTAGPSGLDAKVVTNRATGGVVANCPGDHPYAVGGGGSDNGPSGTTLTPLAESVPEAVFGPPTGWEVRGVDPGDLVVAQAICVK